jgi:hypothetical protein
MSLSPRAKSFLAAAVLLALGFGGGTVFGLWLSARFFTQFLAVSPEAPGPGDYLVDRLVRKLAAELDLTPEERAAVAAEFRASVVQTKRLRAETTLRMREIVRDTNARVAGRLPPAKAAQFRDYTVRHFQSLGLEALVEERTK